MSTTQLERHPDHWELRLAGPKVNVLNEALIGDISGCLDKIEADPAPVLVHSIHKDFVLGADITAFQTWFADPADQVHARIAATQRVFDRFGALEHPTVAWVSGFALGGGFELALACDYRVLDPSARIGLPEVTLGLCPAWGGCVRTAKILGYQAACDFILAGRPVKADVAISMGLGDLAGSDLSTARDYLLSLKDARPQRPAPAAEEVSIPEDRAGQRAAHQIGQLLNRVQGLDELDAQTCEVEVFVALAQAPESQALVQRYLNDQSYKRAGKKQAAQQSDINYVGVLGAGIMGAGIAWQCAISGYNVVVKDIQTDALSQARDEVEKLATQAIKKGRMTEEAAAEVRSRLLLSLDVDALAPCDLVIEAVTEREAVKHAVLAEADRVTRPDTFITSNTSTLSITGLASCVDTPARFAGLHFFNPVVLMPLVEVIVGAETDPATTAQLVRFAQSLNKRPVVVQDCPGFLVNRVLFPYLNAFDAMVAEGHDVAHIDSIMRDYGWPMGPGVLSDVIGIDTCVHASDVMAAGFPDRMPTPNPSALRERMGAGALGQKTGSGLYRFEPDAKGRTSPVSVNSPYDQADIRLPPEQVVERLMRPMIDELVLCVDEGIVESAAVADTACLLGLGFPGWKGGPIYWGQQMGWVQDQY